MKRRVYGYVRVSSRDQNEARQLIALKPYQIPAEHIFIRAAGYPKEEPRNVCQCSAPQAHPILYYSHSICATDILRKASEPNLTTR